MTGSNSMDSMKNIRMGEVLINEGYITQVQLDEALARQKEVRGKRLGDLLVDMGFVTEPQKLAALSKRCAIPMIALDTYQVSMDAVEKIPRQMAEKYKCLPIDFQAGELLVVTNDPLNFFAIEDMRQAAKMGIALCLEALGPIERAIHYYYSELNARAAIVTANLSVPESSMMQEFDLMNQAADDAPVVRLLNSLLIKGYTTNASDIHIEPFAETVRIRLRVDGTIVEYTKLALSVHQSLIARIKILANLDIAEKRVPQDGHFKVSADGTDLNIRVSMMPTVYGEKAVLRYLTTNTKIDYSDSFGMTPQNYDKMLSALSSPHGIVYLTGPTGSGKTTTLYMILDHLARRSVNIITIEDPVERNIHSVNQMQVNNTANLTFEVGLRAILRQDPDIIMIGETRDSETASISVRASITGHLVLSTLHTNDAVSAVVRLEDMGVAPYLVSSSLVCVVAQRLVRKICPECHSSYTPSDRELMLLGQHTDTLHKGRGCPQCNQTGYRGRIAVHEILLIDKTLRGMITQGASTDELFAYAHTQQGMETLREAATRLVLEGKTTMEELLKTAYYEGE